MSRSPSRWIAGLVLCAAAAAAGAEEPSDRDRAYEDRIAELERTVKVLAEELERTRTDTALPDEAALESRFGLGPAASKVYALGRGLSIGGYGEAFYTNYVADQGSASDTADFLRAILYVGYKFNDRIVFNSEIEIEHADEIFLEFAAFDFLLAEPLNLRAGLLLAPMGFLNEIHEPPFFFGVNRPDVERWLIPSTWRENGVGIFGDLGEQLSYKLYALNGFDATGFSAKGIRGGRQKGSQALAEQIGIVGRLDWTPAPGVLVGASFYTGGSGQNQTIEGIRIPDARTTIVEGHAQWRWQGLSLRGLFTGVHIDEAGALTAALTTDPDGMGPISPLLGSGAIAEWMIGGYGELAYDIWPWLAETERSFEPFYRFEWYDTQYEMPSGFTRDRSQRIESHTVGFSFKPIPNLVVKADYRNRSAQEGEIADELNLGIGYVF